MTIFQNRISAGRALADGFVTKNYVDPVILALPRGGVPIAFEIAKRLDAPIDLVMVRKIGLPQQPELAAAAVVNGDNSEIVVNVHIVSRTGLKKEELDRLADKQLAEIRRRRSIYLKDRVQVSVEGRTAIIVDDGIATGATMRASLKAVRRKNPAKLVLAVPVAPTDMVEVLRQEVDELICLETPEYFQAIGQHYVDFSQVPDAEVVQLLDEVGK